MAYCKTIYKEIKTESYLYNSLAYVTNPQKVSQVSFVNENIIVPDVDILDIENTYRRTRNLRSFFK